MRLTQRRNAGRWVDARRDVSADFLRAFGHAPARLNGLANGCLAVIIHGQYSSRGNTEAIGDIPSKQ